jgi:hypothetical protein
MVGREENALLSEQGGPGGVWRRGDLGASGSGAGGGLDGGVLTGGRRSIVLDALSMNRS